jgi:transposase-like protein
MTTEEVSRIIEKMYGHHYTKQTISNITAQIVGDVQAFNHRELSKRYAVIYLDATYLAVRRDTVTKEALYFAIGITADGNKEILSYSLFPTESAHNWEIVLTDLKSRGAEEVLLFVTDGLSGIRDVIQNIYPKARHQSCWVHLARNVSHAVRVKDRSEVLSDLKKVYTQDSLETAETELNVFMATWEKRYPKVTGMFKNNPSLFSFLSFPKQIRASIYTTNLIENFNKHLKRYTKRKEQFPNEDSLYRFVMSQAENYNLKFQQRIHKGFSLVTAELNEMFN